MPQQVPGVIIGMILWDGCVCGSFMHRLYPVFKLGNRTRLWFLVEFSWRWRVPPHWVGETASLEITHTKIREHRQGEEPGV